jgi:hypothetical protein
MSPVAGLTDPTTPPDTSAAATVAPRAGASIIAFEERDACPDCGAPMAADQRYCLACGHRRGDPRLPFMDAATSTGSADARAGAGRTPPPPPPSKQSSRGWNPNAALIVGVAILILAVGLGFLVGRAGHEGSSSANHGSERITIESAGENLPPQARPAPLVETPGTGRGNHHKSAKSPGGATKSKHPSKSESLLEVQEEQALRETQRQLHAKVPLPKPTAKLGESCEQGTAGCGKDKKFEGVFFGAEE